MVLKNGKYREKCLVIRLDIGVDEGPDDRLLPPGSPPFMGQSEIGLGLVHVGPLPLEGGLQSPWVDLEAQLGCALGVEGPRRLFEPEQGAGHVKGHEAAHPRHLAPFYSIRRRLPIENFTSRSPRNPHTLFTFNYICDLCNLKALRG